MTKIGRNSPCPCASGKKYKRCCEKVERAAGVDPGTGAIVRREAAKHRRWLVDISGFPIAIEAEPDALPASFLLTASECILAADVISWVSPEPEPYAAEIASRLVHAMNQLDARPEVVEVRDEEIAAALSVELERRSGAEPVPRVVRGPLGQLRAIGSRLRTELEGGHDPGELGMPLTWAGWRFPDDALDRLFPAAAAFFRAAPWERTAIGDTFHLLLPSGESWELVVAGRRDETPGLSIQRVPGLLRESPREENEPLDTEMPAVVLKFDDRAGLNPELRREFKHSTWQVASEEAYPRMFTIGTRAGGVTRAQMALLTAALRALGRPTSEAAEKLPEGAESTFRLDVPADPEIGSPAFSLFAAPGEAAPLSLSPIDTDVGPLRPGGATGPNARPDAFLDFDPEYADDVAANEYAIVERYAQHLESTDVGSAVVTERQNRAAVFLDFLVYTQGTTLAAVHEFDLILFLYDWYPRKVADTPAQRKTLPASLDAFFRYLDAYEGIHLPAARRLLENRKRLFEYWDAAPEGAWWDEDVRAYRAQVTDQLEERLLYPPSNLGSGHWGDTMGRLEHRLYIDLQRRWLLWRDELIRTGTTDIDALEEELDLRLDGWEDTPHPSCDGLTPIEAIDRERRERQKERGREKEEE